MLKFQRERLGDILPEIEKLLRNQCHEENGPFVVDMEKLLKYDECAYRRQYTVRFNDRIIGHTAIYVVVSGRTGIKTASEETWYLLPQFRKGWNILKFYKFVEQDLKKEGVKALRLTIDDGSTIARILKFLKFNVLSVNYEKVL